MCGVVLENILSVSVVLKDVIKLGLYLAFGQTSCGVICTEYIYQCCFGLRTPRVSVVNKAENYLARTEINSAVLGTVSTAQVDNKLVVNVQPEIVITREVKDYIVTPRVKSADRLHKARAHLHTEEIVRVVYQMQLFVFSRVILVELSDKII